MDWKDIGTRALKTFVQALLSAVTVAAVLDYDVATIKAGVIAAVAAGLSVVWNALLQWSAK